MAKTQSQKLRDILEQQLDRLNAPDCDIEKETKRGDAISKVAGVMVNSQKQEIDFLRLHIEAAKKGLAFNPVDNSLIAIPGGQKDGTNG